ncbi:hypothetical protein CLF_109672 [Clonorchis sinensis]|uniref:Uncharacterized protein n=1 Tax=Clonorchis sinensis TaxID=79923 RepID=G7YSU9_CLOSI|nr:hypothetical protein CLF_109672 [Clonorchis sinensis]
MERLFRPDRFDADPRSYSASEQWIRSHETFTNFLSCVELPNVDKRKLLANFLSPSVYQHVRECTTYEDAIQTLGTMHIMPKSEVFSRHVLATTIEEPGQLVDAFLKKLRYLAKDCNFRAVSADEYRDEAIRNALITGLQCNSVL